MYVCIYVLLNPKNKIKKYPCSALEGMEAPTRCAGRNVEWKHARGEFERTSIPQTDPVPEVSEKPKIAGKAEVPIP